VTRLARSRPDIEIGVEQSLARALILKGKFNQKLKPCHHLLSPVYVSNP